jgi:hypothetical protein
MTQQRSQNGKAEEPAGLGVHNHGPAAEYAQQQGWGAAEEERTQPAGSIEGAYGGTNYEYGARDFGDTPIDEGETRPSPAALDFLLGGEDRPADEKKD